MNKIPNLNNKVCEALFKQEFWYEGVPDTEINVLYLKIEGEAWHRFFFDYGDLFWRETDARDIPDTKSEDLYHYLHTEIGTGLGVVGQIIERVELLEEIGVSEIHFHFKNGIRLIVQHLYPPDSMTLLVVKNSNHEA